MILQALDLYYERMAARGEAEAPGWSREKFGWCVVLAAEGEPIDVTNLHDLSGKKPAPKLYEVPAGVKRTVGIAANFLWDKSAYVLGRTAGQGKRTAQEHAAFVALHLERLAAAEDAGLVALRRFLERWIPERFDSDPFRPEMLDANILFRLEGDDDYLHRRPAARALVAATAGASDVAGTFCLVTGQAAAIQRLHPTIKGVEGAQSSGAALVSFNLDAFASYGKAQGDNAPTSQTATFRYGAALNRMLARGSVNRVSRPIGDATTVFWADAADAQAADRADALFADWLDPPIEDSEEARKLSEKLELVAKGRPLSEIDAKLADGTRFHILGLAPNAARLSVRYWMSGDFRDFAAHLAAHHADLALQPSPWRMPPSINRLLAKTTALQEKFDNIPPLLAGEVMRAVLTGARYPRSWLAAVLMRLRAGDDPDGGWHAAALRAVLAREQRLRRHNKEIPEERETPMSLDRNHRNAGYILGRLFAVYELAQVAALGRGVKATMRDKYFSGASAAPAGIFPLVISGGQNNLTKARKVSPGWAFLIERELEQIMELLDPTLPHTLPKALRLEDQAEFAIGYYHQRKVKLRSDKGEELSLADTVQSEGEPENDR